MTGTHLAFLASGSEQYFQPWKKLGLAPHPNSPHLAPELGVLRASGSLSTLNSRAWIPMVTFEAQGWGEGGLFLTHPLESWQDCSRVPFLSGSQKKEA